MFRAGSRSKHYAIFLLCWHKINNSFLLISSSICAQCSVIVSIVQVCSMSEEGYCHLYCRYTKPYRLYTIPILITFPQAQTTADFSIHLNDVTRFIPTSAFLEWPHSSDVRIKHHCSLWQRLVSNCGVSDLLF